MTIGRRVRVAAFAALVTMGAPLLPASAAPTDPIASKRAEANQVAARLEELETGADVAVEAYLQAQLEAADLDTQVATARLAVAATSAQRATVRAKAVAAAQRAYVHNGITNTFQQTLAALDAGPQAIASSGRVYGEVAIGLTRDLSDQLARTQSDDARSQATLEAELAAQRQAVAERSAARDAADQAVTAQQQELAQVQGELAELVRQEQIRRQQEEERRAREEAARRAAAEAAAREAAAQAAAARRAAAATSTTTSTTVARSTSSTGSGATTPARSTPASSTPASSTPASSTPASSTPATSAPVTPAPGTNVPSVRPGAAGAVEAARSQLGVPYRYAGMTPGVAFDCSGLTSWAWGQAGRSLPHSSAAQFASLPRVPDDQMQPGDLVAFGTPVHHIGIYIGGGQMIHAPQTGRTVEIATIYRRDLRGAVRP